MMPRFHSYPRFKNSCETKEVTTMLSKLLKLIPGWVLDSIYDAIFAELVRRGDIILEEDGWNNNDRN
jgi:hypothetical protein